MEIWAVELSRRKFTREFKLQAVWRLEMGVPAPELARALEVSPNGVQHRRQPDYSFLGIQPVVFQRRESG